MGIVAGLVRLSAGNEWTMLGPVGAASTDSRPAAGSGLGGDGHLVHSRDGSVSIAYEGSLSNCHDASSGLVLRSDASLSNSDLPEAIRTVGSKFLADLRGNFVLAAWNRAASRLSLCRDSLGTRQLYYAAFPRALHFASSLKDLLKQLPRKPELDMPSVDAFLRYGYVPAPRTILRGIDQLKPGEILEFAGSKVVESFSASVPPPAETLVGETHELSVKLRLAIQDALRIALEHSHEPGFLLSGGVDTAALVACARRLGVSPHTYTLALREASGDDESAAARQTSRVLETRHHEIDVGPECLGHLGEITRNSDAPVGNPAALLAYPLFASVRPHFSSVVCGDGGNEVLGGVYKYNQLLNFVSGSGGRFARTVQRAGQWLWYEFRSTRLEPALQRAARSYFKALSKSMAGRPPSIAEDRRAAAVFYSDLESLCPRPDLERMYTEETLHAVGHGLLVPEGLRYLRDEAAHGLPLPQLLPWARVNSFITHNVSSYLGVTSRMASIHPIFPLLSHELLKFLYAIPYPLQYGKSHRHLMRLALRDDLLPCELFDRPLKGFVAPLDAWREHPAWRDRVSDTLAPAAVTRRGLFRPEAVERMVKLFREGVRSEPTALKGRRRSVPMAVWSFLALEVFCDEFLTGSTQSGRDHTPGSSGDPSV